MKPSTAKVGGVLSHNELRQELNIDGIPAGFLVTAIQQVVAFVVLLGTTAGAVEEQIEKRHPLILIAKLMDSFFDWIYECF